MPWPNPVSAGVSRVLASQYDDLLGAVQVWPGGISAGGYALADVGGLSLHTPNATWQEFQLRPVSGAGAAADAIVFQRNARATANAPDAWSDVWKVAQADGAIVFANAVTFLGPVSGLPAASNLTGGVISATDYANFSAAAASMTAWNNDVYSNQHGLYFNTSNAPSYQLFAFVTLPGAAVVNDQFVVQYNRRTIGPGGVDDWRAAVTLDASNGFLRFNTAAYVNNALILNGPVYTNGQTFSGAATFSGVTSFSNINLIGGVETPVSGNPAFGGTARFNGPATFYNTLISAGGLTVNSGLTLNSGVNCNGQTFSGLASFAGNVSLFAGVTISNAAALSIGSNWTYWTPGLSTGTSYSSYGINDAEYFRLGDQIHFKLSVRVTFSGTTNYIALSLPAAAMGGTQVHASMIGQNANSFVAGACYTQGGGSSSLICYLPGWANFAAASYTFYVSGCFRAA